MNAFENLMNSRKFWLLVLDTIISLILYFVGKYTAPEVNQDIEFLIMTLQPVFIAVIVGIFVEDAAVKRYLANEKAKELGL